MLYTTLSHSGAKGSSAKVSSGYHPTVKWTHNKGLFFSVWMVFTDSTLLWDRCFKIEKASIFRICLINEQKQMNCTIHRICSIIKASLLKRNSFTSCSSREFYVACQMGWTTSEWNPMHTTKCFQALFFQRSCSNSEFDVTSCKAE